jgi:SAM-dependent methyltransferase
MNANTSQHRMYHDLAWTWPIVSPPGEYVTLAWQIATLLRKFARRRPIRSLLHLGCGGGHLDFTLKQDFAVTGVDLSTPMLELAHKLNREVTYIEGDMRQIRLNKVFDAVLVADSIDYMLTEDDLLATFRTACEHLPSCGIFLLVPDVTAESFEQHEMAAFTKTAPFDDIAITILRNHFDPNPFDTTFEMTFVYLIRQNSQLRVETDHHLAGLFPSATWLNLLEQAGFIGRTIRKKKTAPYFIGIKK